MNLTDTQKLFLHNVLFRFLTSPNIDFDMRQQASDISSILEEELLNPVTVGLHPHPPDDDWSNDEDSTDQHDSDAEPQEDDEPQVDTYYDIEHFTSLPILAVKNDSGDRLNLRFFEEDDALNIELSFKENGRKVVVDEIFCVTTVTRYGKELHVTSSDEEFIFTVSKYPPQWTESLQVNNVSSP